MTRIKSRKNDLKNKDQSELINKIDLDLQHEKPTSNYKTKRLLTAKNNLTMDQMTSKYANKKKFTFNMPNAKTAINE